MRRLIFAEAHPVALHAWMLPYSADDPSLIARLGGEESVTVPLCSIYHLMEMASRGGSYTDARSNFAYARSPVDHRLMAIHRFVNERNQSEWSRGGAASATGLAVGIARCEQSDCRGGRQAALSQSARAYLDTAAIKVPCADIPINIELNHRWGTLSSTAISAKFAA